MDQRRAFLFFGFMILVWTIFWNVGIRVVAARRNAEKDSPFWRGLNVAV